MHFIFSTLLFLFLLCYCNFRVILEARIPFAINKVLLYLILSCRLWFSCSWSPSTITRSITTQVAVFNRTPVHQSAVCDAAPAAAVSGWGCQSHDSLSHALSHQTSQYYAGWHATLMLPRLHPADIFLRPDKEQHGDEDQIWFTSQGLHHETSRWLLSCPHIQYWCDSKAKSMSHEHSTVKIQESVAVNHPAWHW